MLKHQALLNETDFYFVVSKTYLKSYNKLRFWSVNLALRRIIHNYIISIDIFLISVVKDYDYIIVRIALDFFLVELIEIKNPDLFALTSISNEKTKFRFLMWTGSGKGFVSLFSKMTPLMRRPLCPSIAVCFKP